MKLAIVKIIFKDGNVGYFKNNTIITSSKDEALVTSVNFAYGLCMGLNFAIETYEDELTDHAEVEIIK